MREKEWSRRESNPRPLECHSPLALAQLTTHAHKWREDRISIVEASPCSALSWRDERAEKPQSRRVDVDGAAAYGTSVGSPEDQHRAVSEWGAYAASRRPARGPPTRVVRILPTVAELTE